MSDTVPVTSPTKSAVIVFAKKFAFASRSTIVFATAFDEASPPTKSTMYC